jgi:hypothetical protein
VNGSWKHHRNAALLAGAGLAIGALALTQPVSAQPGAQPGMVPAHAPGGAKTATLEQVTEGFEKVVSFVGERASLYDLYRKDDSPALIAALPAGFENQLLMIAPTVSGGDEQAGVMGPTFYAKWKKIGDRLALVAPDFYFRSTGDAESKRSVSDLYTDTVLLDTPIIANTPAGQPVIALHDALLKNYRMFFSSAFGGYGPTVPGVQAHLAELAAAKAFPENIEVRFEAPSASGRMTGMHFSISVIPDNKSYTPREADSRAGYFNLIFDEMGKPDREQQYTRFISRWQVEKADPDARLSPPKQPIVWYIEHTTPIRYRRYIREGILAWNDAFEKIGIVGALEVYQQDAATGAHMDKDPEDVRYNFFRWNTSNQGYAIGPSRWDPRTGQILDADVVWHEGLTEALRGMYRDVSGDLAVQHFGPETLAWLDENPAFDPRVAFATGPDRQRMLAEARERLEHAPGTPSTDRAAQLHTASNAGAAGAMNAIAFNQCRIGENMGLAGALLSTAIAADLISADPENMLDGLPEEYIGGMIRYIAAHEVGHCLGLQHAWSTSTIRSLEEINQPGYDGPLYGSVMEYAAPNINAEDGPVQGAYATPGVGPYDEWVIAFGYGSEEESKAALARVNEPDLIWHEGGTGMIGPDPRVQVWDLGADSLEFGKSRMRLINDLRPRIATDLVEDGESWAKARQRWQTVLGTQMQAVSFASRWVGASYVNRNFKGDPNPKDPIENVPAAKQREALQFVIDNAFYDESFGVTPELLHKMALEFFPDGPGYANAFQDPSYSVHDTIGAVQASAMTMLLNPTTLRRVHDNEFRTAGEDDQFTLAEMLESIYNATWGELDADPTRPYSATNPMISSFRRNLQREHVARLLFFSRPAIANYSPAFRTIGTLTRAQLADLQERIASVQGRGERSLDPYTRAHLADLSDRIARSLDYTVIDVR